MSNEITLVQIQTALLLPVTANFIIDKLKIAPARIEKRAQFWKREQFTDICQELITHITNVRNVNFDMIAAQRPKPAPKPGTESAPPPAADSNAGGVSFDWGGGSAAAPAPASEDNLFGSAPAAAPAAGDFWK